MVTLCRTDTMTAQTIAFDARPAFIKAPVGSVTH
jgi:hypothetical protein